MHIWSEDFILFPPSTALQVLAEQHLHIFKLRQTQWKLISFQVHAPENTCLHQTLVKIFKFLKKKQKILFAGINSDEYLPFRWRSSIHTHCL